MIGTDLLARLLPCCLSRIRRPLPRLHFSDFWNILVEDCIIFCAVECVYIEVPQGRNEESGNEIAPSVDNTAAKRLRMRNLQHFRFARCSGEFCCSLCGESAAATDEGKKDHKFKKGM